MAMKYVCPKCGLSLTVENELTDKMCPQCMVELNKEEVGDSEVHVAKAVVNATLTSSSRIAAARSVAAMSSETADKIQEVVGNVVTPSIKTGDLDYVKNILEAKICELAVKDEELKKLAEQKKESRETAKAWYQYAQGLEEKVQTLEAKVVELSNRPSSDPEVKPEATDNSVAKAVAIENILNSSEMEAKKIEAAKQMKLELWTKVTSGTSIFMGLLVYLFFLCVRPNVKENTGAIVLIVFVLLSTIVAAIFFVKDMKVSIEKGKAAKEHMRLRKEQSIKAQAEAKKAQKAAAKQEEVVAQPQSVPSEPERVATRGPTPSKKLSSAAAKQAFAARAAAAKRK